jgi:sugar-specific transcriptional regulator TrmB
LAKLRRDGLVQYRRESQTLLYRLADPRTVRVRFREKAEEIRRAARLANSLDKVRELLETAFHFDNMAARVEKRC